MLIYLVRGIQIPNKYYQWKAEIGATNLEFHNNLRVRGMVKDQYPLVKKQFANWNISMFNR